MIQKMLVFVLVSIFFCGFNIDMGEEPGFDFTKSYCVLGHDSNSSPPYTLSRPMNHSIVFGRGIISTNEFEINAAFTPDGRSVYFTRTKDFSWTQNSIYISSFIDGQWSAPQIASFSGTYADADPFITRDGRRLYYISRRPGPGKSTDDYDIWYVERTSSGWGEPISIGPPINTPSDEYYVTLADNGNLYFSRDGEILMAEWNQNGYKTPVSLGKGVNTRLEEYDPYISPDESYLLFTRGTINGPADIFISYKRDGVWTMAESLNELVNTPSHEFAPIVSPDGRYLFFTRMSTWLNGDIYQVELERALR